MTESAIDGALNGAIEIARTRGLVTIQDGGRPGWMHAGVPHGGALAPELLARANAAAENALSTAAIEIVGGAVAVVARARVFVGLEDGARRVLLPGEALEIDPRRDTRVRYLALRGGVDVPRVMGGRGTLVVASLGGHQGRALRVGDALRAGRAPLENPICASETSGGPIRVIPGPDLERFRPAAIDRLFSEAFLVTPQCDRTGMRLGGPTLERADEDALPSMPMVRGAIEVTAEGQAIVLGPDHPTTGGYPVIGVVIAADFGRIMCAPIGSEVRFGKHGE